MPSVPAFPQAVYVEYDEQVDFEIHVVPLEIQVDPQAKHYAVVVPVAAEQFVYRAQAAAAIPAAGSHPQLPSVPIIQLAYKTVFEHPVIAIQFVPLVVQSGDAA